MGCVDCDEVVASIRPKNVVGALKEMSKAQSVRWLVRTPSQRIATVHHGVNKIGAQLPKMAFAWNSIVSEVLGTETGKVTGLKLKDVKTNQERTLPVTGVFIAIGHEPNTSFVKGAIELDEKGYVKTSRGTYTSVEGVFAAGDCVDHVYRQAVTAAGQGCMAAIDVERWLEAQEH